MAMVATRLESISICSKLKLRQVTAIKLKYIVVFVAILSTQSNLGADLKAPAMRPFQKGYWPPNSRPTTRVGGGGRWLSIKPQSAVNPNEYLS